MCFNKIVKKRPSVYLLVLIVRSQLASLFTAQLSSPPDESFVLLFFQTRKVDSFAHIDTMLDQLILFVLFAYFCLFLLFDR